jgi:hypothetical protein
MWCGVADESVVVMNPQPMKAGNRPEDKTEGTAAGSCWAALAKSLCSCEGTKANQSVQPSYRQAWERIMSGDE